MNVRRLLYAACFLEVGLLLIVVPWTTFWERNYLFDLVPPLRDLLHSAYARGAVSGRGLLNVVFGLGDVSAAVSDWLDRPRAAGRA